jgi:hypothetical protein
LSMQDSEQYLFEALRARRKRAALGGTSGVGRRAYLEVRLADLHLRRLDLYEGRQKESVSLTRSRSALSDCLPTLV